MRLLVLLALPIFVVGGVSCGPTDGDPAGGAGITLAVDPPNVVLTLPIGGTASQEYSVTATLRDGSRRDVTAQAVLTVADPALGAFGGSVFQASGEAGGETTVQAAWEGAFGSETLTVMIDDARVGAGAPANAPDLFGAAAEDAGRAPTIVYPSPQTVFPPNIGDFEVHYVDAQNDLFEVSLHTPFVNLRVYQAGAAAAGSFLAFSPAEWAVLGGSSRARPIEISVRGMAQGAPQTAGTVTIGASLTRDDVEGGLYYWAAAGGEEGIFRHDMTRPGEPAEQFYTRSVEPAGRCVACHALSRDGTRMTITFDGGDGASTILDVASRTTVVPTDGSFKWNFATYAPDGAHLVTATRGQLWLRDANGAPLSQVPTAGWATHPDFSPLGDRIVYASPSSAEQDWIFTGGQIVLQPFDSISRTFGPATMLLPAAAENAYYPSFSPDGEWIVFNRSSEDSYDDGSARVYVMKADGSLPPILLQSPDAGAGLTNSWARWAPFAQTTPTAAGGDEALFWLTFSSKRAFGVRLPGGQPQVWMAPFFPERAIAGGDPSAPAFRLPFQAIATSNHIAQWTERIVPLD